MAAQTDYERAAARAEELRQAAHYFLENGGQGARKVRGESPSEPGAAALLDLLGAGAFGVLELAARVELLEITLEEELRELRDRVVEELELGRVELGAHLERLTAAVDELPGGDE